MASTSSDEASDIRRRGRQRLIGAVAVALLLIVFVPMFFDPEPRPSKREPSLDIPSRDNPAPLPAPTPASSTTGTTAPIAPAAEKPQPAAPTSAPVAEKPQVAAAAPAPAAEKPAAAAPRKPVAEPVKMEGFAVQVGAFRDEAKLAHAREKLTAAKLRNFTEPSGGLTRLRAGPFATREAADKAAATIKSLSLDAKVVPLP